MADRHPEKAAPSEIGAGGANEATGLRMTFDGRPIAARPGQSVAAALLRAGIVSWRLTRRTGRPRGLFCGIGICYDCLLTVDGVPDQRACLVPAAHGLELSTDDRWAQAVQPHPNDTQAPAR